MKGFTFANIHSSEYELYVRSDNRTVTPSLRRNSIIIPQKHGTIEFDNSTYDVRNITMHLYLVRKTMEDLRHQARNIAKWLSKDGLLVFDDEPDKAYKAKVYHNIDIDEIGAYGKSKVTFTCQPFASSIELHNIEGVISNSPQFLDAETIGTYETPPIITLENIGSNTIKTFNIQIERKER